MSPSQRMSQTKTNSKTWSQPTPTIAARDAAPGCIVFLPKPSDLPSIICEATHHCNSHALNDKAFNHPVLVLQTRQREGSVFKGDILAVVAVITSFTNLTLRQFFAQKGKAKSHFLKMALPLVNTDFDLGVLPQEARVLRLDHGELTKQSYVLVNHVFALPVSWLRSYSHVYPRAFEVRVGEGSMKEVMERFETEVQEWESNDDVQARADERLEALCKPWNGVNSPNSSLSRATKGGNETVDGEITGSRVQSQLNPRAAAFEFPARTSG